MTDNTTTTTTEAADKQSETGPEEKQQATESRQPDGHQVCPECNGRLISDERHGETRCEDCGLVVDEDEVDRGPEWRSYTESEKEERTRVGAPTTKMMHDEGLSTNIGWQDKDAYGNNLSARKRKRMKRLRTWNERFRTRDAKERNLRQALGEIDRMASALGLPENVRETASVIYRRALDEDLLPGRSIEGVATAALYAAARQANNPRSLDEMNAVSRVEKMEISRTYRYMMRNLGLEIEPADPTRYVNRFISEAGIDKQVEQQARALLENAKEEAIHSGKSPVGLAAAAVYAASLLENNKVTQSTVSDIADVSEVTIRNRYKELLAVADMPRP